MKILQVFSPQVDEQHLDKVGATRIGSLLFGELKNRHLDVDLMANTPQATYLIPASRRHGRQTSDRLWEVAGQYDVVHVHLQYLGFMNYLVPLAEHFKKTRFVVTHHTPPDLGIDLSYRYQADYHKAHSLSNLWQVFVSRSHLVRYLKACKPPQFGGATAEAVLSLPPRTTCCVICYNGVKLPDGHLAKRGIEHFITPEYEAIVVGRLDRSKRIVEALRLCLESTKGDVLYVGSPANTSTKKTDQWVSYVQQFKALQREYGSRLCWTPQVRNEALISHGYSSARANVALSSIETFGLTAAEAAVMGIPSVVGNGGGLKEIVDSVGGERIDERNWHHFRDVLQAAQDMSTERRANLARLARAMFSLEAMVNRYIKIYEET